MSTAPRAARASPSCAVRTTLLVIGRVKEPFAAADAHYRKLLGRYLDLDVIEVRDGAELERRIPTDAHVIALDRGGRLLDSLEWSEWLERRRLEARDTCILIGGPEGLPGPALARARERLSLGAATLAHQLARVVLLEQLFRAAKIAAGEPYHR
jgi:23S rRNA (pseudouridine1915-N3)-methyltransferase